MQFKSEVMFDDRNEIAMTIKEASSYTGIGRNTMRNLVEWKLPVLKIGEKVTYQKRYFGKVHGSELLLSQIKKASEGRLF